MTDYSANISASHVEKGKVELDKVFVGMRFFNKDYKDTIYTVSEIKGRSATITWDEENSIRYAIGSIEAFINDGSWVIEPNTSPQQSDTKRLFELLETEFRHRKTDANLYNGIILPSSALDDMWNDFCLTHNLNHLK